MKRLGAILAGGQSRRFGSDKALAILDGQTLLERAVAAVAPLCDAVVIVGREHPSIVSVADWPRPGMGPLGGLAGALGYAEDNGFVEVLSVPVDCGPLPDDVLDLLQPNPSFLESQPVIGLWPSTSIAQLRDILNGDGSHAVRHFTDAIGARAVSGVSPANINTPDDLTREASALKDGGD